MSGEHTSEPWEFPRLANTHPFEGARFSVPTPENEAVELVSVTLTATDFARARLCVNACAGMYDPERTIRNLNADAVTADRELARLCDQREELLEALHAIAKNPGFPDHHIRAAAAIAKVRS